MKFKNIITLTALFSFAALIISAAIASLFSLWKELTVLHISLSILFGISYVIQTTLEIKKESSNNRITGNKRQWLTVNSYTAILLTGWVILGSLLQWPPFNLIESQEEAGPTEEQIQQTVLEEPIEGPDERNPLPEKMKWYWSNRTLRDLSENYTININTIHSGLEGVGIESSPDWKLKEIAEHNDMETKSVYEAVLQVQ